MKPVKDETLLKKVIGRHVVDNMHVLLVTATRNDVTRTLVFKSDGSAELDQFLTSDLESGAALSLIFEKLCVVKYSDCIGKRLIVDGNCVVGWPTNYFGSVNGQLTFIMDDFKW